MNTFKCPACGSNDRRDHSIVCDWIDYRAALDVNHRARAVIIRKAVRVDRSTDAGLAEFADLMARSKRLAIASDTLLAKLTSLEVSL